MSYYTLLYCTILYYAFMASRREYFLQGGQGAGARPRQGGRAREGLYKCKYEYSKAYNILIHIYIYIYM